MNDSLGSCLSVALTLLIKHDIVAEEDVLQAIKHKRKGLYELLENKCIERMEELEKNTSAGS